MKGKIKDITDEMLGPKEVEVTKANGEKVKEREGNLLREYYHACDLSNSLTAKDSLHAKTTKPIHVGGNYREWKKLHARVDKDKNLMFAENEQELKRLESKGFKEISLKDAKQRLEKLIEEKSVPIKIGELIGNKLEDEIREGLGISKEDWENQKKVRKDGNGKEVSGIKYCFAPPKYVFKCIDRNGRETYYFTNDKKGPGKKEGMKKATRVELDSEALRVLEESRDQGNLKIINLKDIYQFKGKDGEWYITNNEKFGNTPYGMSRSINIVKQVHDFETERDDKDKKSWWRSIFNWGGDKSENKDWKHDEDRDDDDYRDKYRYGYGSNYPYSPYTLNLLS